MIESLPAVNAALNAVAAVLLACGWICIRRRCIAAHKTCMIGAFITSCLFLACYLVYHALHGSRPFPGTGGWRVAYFAVLVPHIILAIGMLPFIFIAMARALGGQFDRHVAVARWTLPVWLYVSVTGVAVYVMLYQIRWD